MEEIACLLIFHSADGLIKEYRRCKKVPAPAGCREESFCEGWSEGAELLYGDGEPRHGDHLRGSEF